MTWARRRPFWVALLVLSCALYAPALSYGFISYDDPLYVFNNRVVSQGLTWEGIRWAFGSQHYGHYHPLTWLSHQLDVSLFGMDGRGHHATSLALHAASSLLLFLFLHRSTEQIGRSGVTALLFALHPLHVEPVVWIASRKDVLSTLFWMLALVAYERYCRAPTRLRYLAVLVAYVAGVLSKPMAVTLPAILLLLDYWPLRRLVVSGSARQWPEPQAAAAGLPRRTAKYLIAEKLPLLLVAGVSSWITTTSASEFGVMQAQNLPLTARIQNALVSYVLYLRELILPVDLSIHHERFLAAPPALYLWGSVAVLTVISALALRRPHAQPAVAVGWLFYLVSFLPVIGLLQYGGHSIADRYAYVPSMGAFVLSVWGLHALFARLPNARVLQTAVTAAVSLVFALLSVLQVGYWRSGEELFQHALDIAPNNPRVLNLLAGELLQRGAIDEAAKHYARALELAPRETTTLNNLGVLLYRKGRISEAIELYRRALGVDPREPNAHTNLALALADQGRSQEAETHYRIAIREAPDYGQARLGLARLLTSVGRTPEARAELEAAISRFPHRTDFRKALADLPAAAGARRDP